MKETKSIEMAVGVWQEKKCIFFWRGYIHSIITNAKLYLGWFPSAKVKWSWQPSGCFLFLLCFVEGFFCGRGNGDDRFEKVFFFLRRCIKTKVQFLFTSNRHITLFCLAEIGYHPKCQVMSVIWCSAPFLSKQYSCSVRSSASVHMAQHHKACKR